MKNKDAIEALIWFKSVASDALDGLGLAIEIKNNYEKILKALEEQEDHIVEANEKVIEKLKQAQEDFDNSVDLIQTAIDMLSKGSNSIPLEKPCVDVEWLIDDIEDVMSNTNDVDVTLHDFAKAVANHLHEQGHLTLSEKPTQSIPEGFALAPVDLNDYIRYAVHFAEYKLVNEKDGIGLNEDQLRQVTLSKIDDEAQREIDIAGYKAMIKAVQDD